MKYSEINCSNLFYHILFISLFFILSLILIILLRYYIKLSQTDETTSIKNFRGFRKVIKKIILRQKQKSSPFTLILLDIDQFRNFNFQGYDFGDAVLREFVKFISEQLPQKSIMARFKFGDEFILIIHSDVITASKTIKQIQQNCALNLFHSSENQEPYHVHFSYGLAQFDEINNTLEKLLNCSEIELKKNKRKHVQTEA
ncbi:MAG: GGDEF domain-containing protein [Bacteroidota bacterium]